MKAGDLVSFVYKKKPNEELEPSAVPLLKNPPDFTSNAINVTITSWFMGGHIGLVLDEKDVQYSTNPSEKWTYIMCPTGKGWVSSSSLQIYKNINV